MEYAARISLLIADIHKELEKLKADWVSEKNVAWNYNATHLHGEIVALEWALSQIHIHLDGGEHDKIVEKLCEEPT